MDITFSCDKCGQQIAIDEAGAGQLIDCPKCGTPLEVPYKSKPSTSANTPPQPPAPAAPPDKKCPFCAETIKTEAKICRFCGYDFLTGQSPAKSAATASTRNSSRMPKILTALVIVAALGGGGFFAFNSWKNQRATSQTGTALDKILPDITLDGQVFIVTKGAENIKLGLVIVDVISLADLTPYLNSKVTKATTEIAGLTQLANMTEEYEADVKRLGAKVTQLEAEATNLNPDTQVKDVRAIDPEQLKKAIQTGSAAVQALFEKRDASASRDAYEAARKRAAAAAQEAKSAHLKMDAARAAPSMIRYYHSAEFYFGSLPQPFRSTKTDADGRFQIQVPRSGSYALAASASRHVGDSVENYYWLFQIDNHANSPQKIMLSNDNLFLGIDQYPVQDWQEFLKRR